MRTSSTVATTIITTTPIANGSGLKIDVAASTSALAFDSSWPVGCCRCHDIGSRRYWRVTAVRWSSWISANPRPANMRRAATVSASDTATSAIAPPAEPDPVPRLRSIPASAGTTTWSVTAPSTRLTATVSDAEERGRPDGQGVGAGVRAHAPAEQLERRDAARSR